MTTDPETRAVIKEYLSLDETSLYNLIPLYVPAYKHTFFSPEGEVEAGRKEFHAIRNKLYQLVCVDWGYCSRRNDPDLQDSIALVIAVADVISAACGAIPPFLIAALLVKKGLNVFCNCQKNIASETTKPTSK